MPFKWKVIVVILYVCVAPLSLRDYEFLLSRQVFKGWNGMSKVRITKILM